MADIHFGRGCMRSSAEIGTIVGPNAFGELLTVRSCQHSEKEDCNDRRDFWTATADEIKAVKDPEHSPRSLTEINLRNRRTA